jgi:aminopeptidase N
MSFACLPIGRLIIFCLMLQSLGLVSAQTSVATKTTDIQFWGIQLALNADSGSIYGKVETHFAAEADENLLSFDLSSKLSVDSVFLNGSPVAFSQLQENELRIFAPLYANQQYVSVVFYHGTPNQGSGLGGVFVGKRNGISEMWTLSQPFSASDWWPTKNTLSDKADSLQMEFFYDTLLQVAAPGILIESSPGRSLWKHRYPIPAYLVAFALSNYDTSSSKLSACSDTIPFSLYRFPEGNGNLMAQAEMVQEGLNLFCDWLGPYPYANEKYGHAQFSRGGGMEHPTISFMGSFGLELTLHELVHHWFGNMITCGSWADIWLNEGFATYLAGMGIEKMNENQWIGWKQTQRAAVYELPDDGTVFVTDSLNVSRIFSSRWSYKKAALVLHQLRLWLGDSVFLDGLKLYLNNANLKWKFSRTSDFRESMQAISGYNLTGFFDGWIYTKGLPKLKIQATGMSPRSVLLQVEQSPHQNNQQVTPSWVSVSFRNGATEQRVDFMLEHLLKDSLVNLDFIPLEAVVDPEANMLAQVKEFIFNPFQIVGGSLFPNPGTNPILMCTEPIHRLRLISTTGQLLQQWEQPQCGTPLPFKSEIPAGLYLLEYDFQGMLYYHKYVLAQH